MCLQAWTFRKIVYEKLLLKVKLNYPCKCLAICTLWGWPHRSPALHRVGEGVCRTGSTREK